MMGTSMRDELLKATLALPDTQGSVKGAAIEIGNTERADFDVRCEAEVVAPALVVGDLGNGDTMTYSVITSETADFNESTVLCRDVIVQTGADGAGAASQAAKVRLPISGVLKYVGIEIENSDYNDASDKSATLSLLF